MAETVVQGLLLDLYHQSSCTRTVVNTLWLITLFIIKYDLKNKTPNVETVEIFQFGGNYYPYNPVIPSYTPKISIALLNQLQEIKFQKLVIDGLRWDDLSNEDENLSKNHNIKVCHWNRMKIFISCRHEIKKHLFIFFIGGLTIFGIWFQNLFIKSNNQFRNYKSGFSGFWPRVLQALLFSFFYENSWWFQFRNWLLNCSS